MDKNERCKESARLRESKRIKEICSCCNKEKICRYAGPVCQTCYARYKNPSLYLKILERNKKHSKTFEGRYSKIKTQAKYRKKDFNISKEFYRNLLEKLCHYCNSNFDGGIWADRIDNSLGYTESNILPACGTCNRIRNTFLTVAEMKIAMQAILNYRKNSPLLL